MSSQALGHISNAVSRIQEDIKSKNFIGNSRLMRDLWGPSRGCQDKVPLGWDLPSKGLVSNEIVGPKSILRASSERTLFSCQKPCLLILSIVPFQCGTSGDQREIKFRL
jgi:hypothetical protein